MRAQHDCSLSATSVLPSCWRHPRLRFNPIHVAASFELLRGRFFPGATYFKWKLPQQEEAVRLNCGESYIEHWLQQMDTVKEDLPHLRTARVVMFENFTVGERFVFGVRPARPRSLPFPSRPAPAHIFTQKPTLLPPTRLARGAGVGVGVWGG